MSEETGPVIKAVMTCKDLGTAPKSFGFEDYTTEPKMDGIRIYAVVDPGKVRFFTRSHRDVTLKLPHLRDALEDWSIASAASHPQLGEQQRVILDGELVYYNALTGEVDFTWAEGVISGPLYEHAVAKQRDNNKWCTLMVFDCLVSEGIDITRFAIETRRQIVKEVVDQVRHVCLVQMPWVNGAGVDIINEMTQRFGEGAVLKRRESPYEYKRSGLWLKTKQEATADVVAMGAIMAAPGKFEGMIGAIEFGQYKECENCWGSGRVIGALCSVCGGSQFKLTYRGKCSGMDDRTRRYITDNLEAIINRGDVFEIKHNGTFESGLFRHPNFLRWRTSEKDAGECLWDEIGISVLKRS